MGLSRKASTLAAGLVLLSALSSAVQSQGNKVEEFIQALAALESPPFESKSIADGRYLKAVLLGRRVLEGHDPPAVEEFRKQAGPRETRILASLVNLPDRDIRINASVILDTVVDEKNVCGVLEVLLTQELQPAATSNLLQIVNLVADRSYEEVGIWTEGVLDRLAHQDGLASGATPEIVESLRSKISASAEGSYGTMQSNAREDYEKCIGLPGLATPELGVLGTTIRGNPNWTDLSLFVCSRDQLELGQVVQRFLVERLTEERFGSVAFNLWDPGRDDPDAAALSGSITIIYDDDPKGEMGELPKLEALLKEIPGLPPVQTRRNSGKETRWNISVVVCP